MKKLFALIFVALLMTTSSVSAKDESFFDGYLDYDIDAENKIISTIGYGWGPKGSTLKDSFSKTYARQAARLDALRSLAEEIQGVDVEPSMSILDAKVHISSTVLKKAWQVGDAEFIQDGDQIVCRVKMATEYDK